MSEHIAQRRLRWNAVGTRWLGVGLAAILCVVTIALAVTGRLSLYVNPDGAWFAVGMAVVGLIGTIASFALPLGAESDHGHDHGVAPAPAPMPVPVVTVTTDDVPLTRAEARARRAALAEPDPVADHDEHAHHHEGAHVSERPLTVAATVTGGVLASSVMIATLVLPPASLSAELAMARDLGVAPLFGGADVVSLATTGDLSAFGIGEWANVFQNTPDPRAFDGTTVTLMGFVAPGADDDTARLSRLVVTHCVIDAQPAGVPVALADWAAVYDTGTWVEISGTVRETDNGSLVIEPSEVTKIDEPAEPYEY